jgi:beta-glucosidase
MWTCAANSALVGWWNDCLTSEGAFVRAVRNLCMAHELAVEAILAERPNAVIVHGERIERFVPVGERARHAAERLNAFRYLALDLACGHELAPGMAALLNEHGVMSNDLSFFREPRAVGQRWLGLDYFRESEQRVALTGRRTSLGDRLGFRGLALEYHRRYRLPIVYRGTHDTSGRAVRWLGEQWRDLMAVRSAGVPVVGFGWSSLTDQIDGEHSLRRELNEPYRIGLVGLDRRPRLVRDAFRSLIERWRATCGRDGADAGGSDQGDLAANA